MELGYVETRNFEGRVFTVPGDPGEPTQAQVRKQMLQYCSKLQLVKVCHQIPSEAEHPSLVQLYKGTRHCHLTRYERSQGGGTDAQTWEIPYPAPLTQTSCTQKAPVNNTAP